MKARPRKIYRPSALQTVDNMSITQLVVRVAKDGTSMVDGHGPWTQGRISRDIFCN